MAKTRGTGLFMVWMDVGPEHEAEFNRWYNEEHLKHVLEVPGFLSGAWYVALEGGPKYLTMYALEDHRGVRTSAFLDGTRYKPSPWRTQASPERVGRNFLINVHCQIFPMRTSPSEQTMETPRDLQMGRMDIPAHMEEAFNDWDTSVYLPGYLTVPGCIRARRFVVVEGQPQYLSVYEFERPDVPESEAWLTVRNSNPWTHRVRLHLRLDDGSPGVYRRIYPE